MILIRTTKIKLHILPKEVLPTIEACTKSFNYICQIGHNDKDFNKVSLHNKTYHIVREKFKLPAELAIQMREKSSWILKKSIQNETKCPKSKQISIPYSKNSYNIWFNKNLASILTINGRLKCSFDFPKNFEKFLTWRRKGAELIVRKNKVYLCVAFEKDVEDIQISENPTILGIDRGINKVAVCSDNTFFNPNIIKVSNRYQRLRQNLQKCGSKSAKRHLRRISGKENRFRQDVNHCVSKQIVSSVPTGGIIVLEDLKYITKRAKKWRKKENRKLHNWSFYQLEQFITYKAQEKGVIVDYVDARYTSQKCSNCGHTSKKNRKSQAVFCCEHCGFSLNADLNAARNIELNYRDAKGYPEGLSVNQPIVGTS